MAVQYKIDFNKTLVPNQIKSTNWNVQSGRGDGSKSGIPWPPLVVSDIGGRTGKCYKFELPSDGKRQEVEPNHLTFDGKKPYYFKFSFYLDKNFPLGKSDWHVIWQLHGNDTTSPRFALQAHKGALTVGDNGSPAPITVGKWYDCIVYADFPNGQMTTWLNGTKVHDKFNCGKSNPNYYLKLGSYQSPSIGAGIIYMNGFMVADTFSDVADTPAPTNNAETPTKQELASDVANIAIDLESLRTKINNLPD